MKKTLLFITLLLTLAGSLQAVEYVAFQPSEPFRISWDNSAWTGSYYDTRDKSAEGAFTSLSAGDVIKIHVTGVVGTVGSDCQAAISIKPGPSWEWATLPASLVTANLAGGIISVTVGEGNSTYGNSATEVTWTAAEMANYIKERGLVVSGIRYRLLDITVSTSNVSEGDSYTLLDNPTEITFPRSVVGSFGMRYADYSSVKVGDVLNIAYTSATNASMQLQDISNSWGTIAGSERSSLSGSGTISYTLTDDLYALLVKGTTLSDKNNNGIAIYISANISISSVTITRSYTMAGYRPVYIPAGGYATFYGTSTCALPTDVKAYYVSETSTTSATLAEISNIPANQGVILKGATGIYQLYTTDAAAASVTDNKLVGATARTQITSTTDKYILYDNNGTPEFRKITANSYLDAYKCYLDVTGAGARLSLIFDDEGTTGVSDVRSKTSEVRNEYFDLSGRRVAQPTKGLYIVNGKKVVIK